MLCSVFGWVAGGFLWVWFFTFLLEAMIPVCTGSWMNSEWRCKLKNSFILERGKKLLWTDVGKDTSTKSVLLAHGSTVTVTTFWFCFNVNYCLAACGLFIGAEQLCCCSMMPVAMRYLSLTVTGLAKGACTHAAEKYKGIAGFAHLSVALTNGLSNLTLSVVQPHSKIKTSFGLPALAVIVLS